MSLKPTIGNRAMHRRALCADFAARAQERMVDRTDRYPACVIGFNPGDNFEQLRQCGFRVGDRAIFLEFHVPRFRSYRRVPLGYFQRIDVHSRYHLRSARQGIGHQGRQFQSFSRSRRTASLSGFFELSHSFDGPLR
jgi:hypothetical protein